MHPLSLSPAHLHTYGPRQRCPAREPRASPSTGPATRPTTHHTSGESPHPCQPPKTCPGTPDPLPLQVHSLALRPAGPHLPALAMKPPGGAPPRAGPPRGPPPDPPAEHLKKTEGHEGRAHGLARATAPAAAHPLVTPGKWLLWGGGHPWVLGESWAGHSETWWWPTLVCPVPCHLPVFGTLWVHPLTGRAPAWEGLSMHRIPGSYGVQGTGAVRV